ncbi:MAG: GGDEF domain-containing protein [Candidatus Electrothrix sp. AR3]|nr:GGDEF domain-containing protein [Candidatus Electrothrix sp. AR3]
MYNQQLRLKEIIYELEETKQLVLEQNRLLERLSTHDDLTGLYNRRHLVTSLKQEFSLCQRHNNMLSLMILDLDHFKDINDTFGHEFGDYVLKDFSNTLRTHVRRSDLVFRFGGEEFIILLPQTDEAGALSMAEKIRQVCEEKQIQKADCITQLTVSIGVISYQRDLHQSPGCMISSADKALYQAKEMGRNRIIVFRKNDSTDKTAVRAGERL